MNRKIQAALNQPESQSLTRLALNLVSALQEMALIIFMAMLVESAISLASPWPLKIIIDNVINENPLAALACLAEYSAAGNLFYGPGRCIRSFTGPTDSHWRPRRLYWILILPKVLPSIWPMTSEDGFTIDCNIFHLPITIHTR